MFLFSVNAFLSLGRRDQVFSLANQYLLVLKKGHFGVLSMVIILGIQKSGKFLELSSPMRTFGFQIKTVKKYFVFYFLTAVYFLKTLNNGLLIPEKFF